MNKKFQFFNDAKWFVFAVVLAMFVPFLQSCMDEYVDAPSEHDSEAPSIYILNPTSEDVFVTTDSAIVISGTASDNTMLKSINYTSSTGASGVATGLENWSVQGLKLAQGDNKIRVTAVDEDNNSSSASITITKNQYITFLGTPTVSNDVLYVNTPTELWITVSIAPNEHLIGSSVKIIEVDAANNPVEDVCTMYDDGNLDHGDEIKGDNVFSVKHTFNYGTEGTKRFRVSAKTSEEEGEVEGFSAVFTLTVVNEQNAAQQVKNMLELHDMVSDKLSTLEGVAASEKAVAVTEWLNSLPEVGNAVNNDGFITITHVSGLESYVMINKEGSEVKGGDVARRRTTPGLPLSRQTRGIYSAPTMHRAPSYNSSSFSPLNIIQNKNVLIWAPFEDQFDIDMQPTLSKIFSDSQVKFNVKYSKNSECDRASLYGLGKYGIIIFDTHGSGGNLLVTREQASASDFLAFQEISDLFSGIFSIVTLQDKHHYYAATAKFFKEQSVGTLPNSVVFNGSCQSMKTTKLANALISRGAKTYLGFKANVMTSTCRDKADQFFTGLVGNELKTTGEAYISDLDFIENDGTKTWYNSYLMTGSKDMRFYLGLVNGDFEYGNLNGWDTDGDGRIITQLGSQKPAQGAFMGIVSTGLGYTEKYGRISQSFKVTNESTLSIRWNFLSEEFLEYVGSIYQDYLRISISDGSTTTVLLSLAIDDFDKHYSLTKVSPTIVFDCGDVYMTGWQNSTFDISQYKGRNVTLTIETGDIGDSIYDSATLLDDISIY